MSAHVIKLTRPLKHAIAIPIGRSTKSDALHSSQTQASLVTAAPMTASTSGDVEQKLVETAPSEPATTALPQIENLLKNVDRTANLLVQNQQQTIHQFQELAVELATEIASAVVQHEVTQHTTRIQQLISQTLENADADHTSPSITVRVHPADCQRLKEMEIPDDWLGNSIHWQPDARISMGDCEIETQQTNVIADYRRQLVDIRQQLMESLHNARAEPATSQAIDPND